MIQSNNSKLPFNIKMVFLVVCIIVGKPGKSMNARCIPDTLGNTGGTVVDSVTKLPVPYATVIVYKDDFSTMTIVSNEKGEFTTDVKLLKSKIQVSAIGYQQGECYLATGHSNLLLFMPADKQLPNVSVASKAKQKPNADWLIKKVNKNIEQNYGGLSFDQKFEVHTTTHNYDTLKEETINRVNLLFFNGFKKNRCRSKTGL